MSIVTLYKHDLVGDFPDKLATFLEEQSNCSKEERKLQFAFRWEENPWLDENTAIGWAILDVDGNIHGFMGNIPIMLEYGNTSLYSSSSATWYISEEYRGKNSGYIYLLFSRQKENHIYLNTSPTIQVQEMLPAMGFRKIEYEAWNYNHIYIISILSCIVKKAHVLFTDRMSTTKGFMKTVYHMFSVVTKPFTLLPKKRVDNTSPKQLPTLKTKNGTIQYAASLKDIAPYLSRHKNTTALEISKDETTINWLFFSKSVRNLFNREVFLLFTSDDDYAGYAVVDYPRSNSSMIIRDINMLNYNQKLVRHFIRYMIKIGREHHRSYLMFRTSDAELSKIINSHGHLKIYTPSSYFIKVNRHLHENEEELLSAIKPSGLEPDAGFI